MEKVGLRQFEKHLYTRIQIVMKEDLKEQHIYYIFKVQYFESFKNHTKLRRISFVTFTT